MYYYRVILFLFVISFQCNQNYSASRYKDSVFSVCFLKFKRPPWSRLHPKKMSKEEISSRLIKEIDRSGRWKIYDEENSVYPFTYLAKYLTEGTAFYIGDGRFVTNFHLVVNDYRTKLDSMIVIKYKDKILHIDKILHYESLFDLLVLHSNSKYTKELKPLEIASSQDDFRADTLTGFNYENNALIDLDLSLNTIVERKHEKIFIEFLKILKGMSGSPLLSQGKLVGILTGTSSPEIDAVLTSSFVLSNLLKRKEIRCTIDECIADGIDHLEKEVRKGNLDARAELNVYTQELKFLPLRQWFNKQFKIF